MSVFLASLLSLWATAALAQERGRALQLSGGIFNVGKSPTQVEAGLELRRPLRWLGLDFTAGAAATEEGSFWGYLGVRRDFAAGDKWVIAPGFGVGAYEQGDGKDLGGSVQFRSALDVAYRMTPRTRLGVTAYHLSNAGLEEVNPGSNAVVVSYGFELGR